MAPLLVKLPLAILTNIAVWNSYALAGSPTFQITPGQSRSLDVANTNGMVALRIELRKKDGFAEPHAHVTKEDGGMECKFDRTILKTSDYDEATKIWTQVYEVRILWEPGTDSSYCDVSVHSPENPPSTVILRMDY